MDFFIDFFLEAYLQHGLTEIYEIESDFTESDAGYGHHDHRTTVVGRKGDRFVKLSAHEHATFGFKSKRSLGVTGEEPISESQYRELSAGKERIDTPAKVQTVKANRESLLRRYDAEDKLNAIEHPCPKCGRRMHWKGGRYGPFWGCTDYPSCDGTINMTNDEKKLYRQYSREDQPAPVHQ